MLKASAQGIFSNLDVRSMYQEFVKRFAALGCQVITSEEEYRASTVHVRKFKFHITATCGHSRVVSYYDFSAKGKYQCVPCNQKEGLNQRRATYAHVTTTLKQHGCTLLTTQEEFDSQSTSLCKKSLRILAKCGHERVATLYTFLEGQGNCLECNKATPSSQQEQRMLQNLHEVRTKLEAMGVELLTTEEEYLQNLAGVKNKKYTIRATCGHEHQVRVTDFQDSMRLCGPCARKAKHNGNLSYEEIQHRFQRVGCRLLTPKDLFQNEHMTCSSQFTFEATCGHERTAIFKNLDLYEGILCKQCSARKSAHEQVQRALRDGMSSTVVLEFESLCYLRGLLEEEFEVVLLREGTRADLAVKPRGVVEDAWLGVQVKCTEKPRNEHKFQFTMGNGTYENMCIVCVCVQTKSIWVVPLPTCRRFICITDKEGCKYQECKVSNLVDAMNQAYHKTRHLPITDLQTPKGPTGLLERQFQQLRERHVPFLTFQPPEMNYLPYDFKVNGLKVQEKVMDKYGWCIKKSCGRNKKQPYAIGDNDFYWLHCRDQDTFFVIPEKVLVEHGHVGGSTSWLSANLKKVPWLKKFMFSYRNIHQSMLQQLFSGSDLGRRE